jgi:hypothetical protein
LATDELRWPSFESFVPLYRIRIMDFHKPLY